MQEVKNAIMTLKPNKARGLDSFMEDFYKLFKEVSSEKLQLVFEECLEERRIPLSWLAGNT